SPVVDGERATIELVLPPGVSPGDATLEMPTISHLGVSAADLKAAPDPFKAIGASGSCEVDVVCLTNAPASAAVTSAATALLRLNDAAPAGASFAAWRAEPVATGAAADALHHPKGDLTKLSTGTTTGYHTYNDGSTFLQMRWQLGVTEPGSSGAGLFTLSPD